ncbi:MAG: hypothetical protein PHE49_09625 [bacterium]|nr:hypothetical protein [bacterium]
MTKKQIKQEYKKITTELRFNKPKIAPYPPEIVKRREFLLFAQVHLGNILGAKSKKEKRKERFETEMYNKIMEFYYYLGKKNETIQNS